MFITAIQRGLGVGAGKAATAGAVALDVSRCSIYIVNLWQKRNQQVSLTKDILGKYEAKCNRSSNLTQSNCRRLRLATLWRLFQHLPFQKQDGACSPQLDTKPGAPKEQGAQEGRIVPAKNKCYNVSAAASSFASAPGLHGVHRNNRNPDQTISQSWPILEDFNPEQVLE